MNAKVNQVDFMRSIVEGMTPDERAAQLAKMREDVFPNSTAVPATPGGDGKAGDKKGQAIASLGQLMMQKPQMNAPPRAQVVGSAPQVQPILPTTQMLDPRVAPLLQLMGVRNG